MRPFAMLLTARSSVSESLMGYRFPTSILLLADGKGGFWLGGQTALVHWHAGESEKYSSRVGKR